jgi:hypothetical protein
VTIAHNNAIPETAERPLGRINMTTSLMRTLELNNDDSHRFENGKGHQKEAENQITIG